MSGLITGDPGKTAGAGRHRPRPDAGDTHRDALPEDTGLRTPPRMRSVMAPVGYAQARPVVGRLHMFETTMEIPDGQGTIRGRSPRDRSTSATSIPTAARPRSPGTDSTSSLPRVQSASGRQRAVDRETLSDRTWRSTADAQPWVQGTPMRNHWTSSPPSASTRRPYCAWPRPNTRTGAASTDANGWTHGKRDNGRKHHDHLVPWSEIEADPAKVTRALTSLAGTLTKLRELGYQTARKNDDDVSAIDDWQTFRARPARSSRDSSSRDWTWTTSGGDAMTAGPGDWEVRTSPDDPVRSVRDDVFTATYELVDGDRYRRIGE